MVKQSKEELNNDSFEDNDDLYKDDVGFSLVPVGYLEKFENIFKMMGPYLGANETQIVIAQVMIALKVEGILGNELTPKETKMIRVIKDAIIAEPEKKKEALSYARQLLK